MSHILYLLFNLFHAIMHRLAWILQRNKSAQKHMYWYWINYNNLFITCDQLTDVEVKTSFQVFFACIIKELLTEKRHGYCSYGLRGLEQWNEVSPSRPDRGWYVPPIRRGRGLRPLSPPHLRPPTPSTSFPHPRSPMEADTQPGRGRGLQTSPSRRGRGLLIVLTGGKRSETYFSSPCR